MILIKELETLIMVRRIVWNLIKLKLRSKNLIKKVLLILQRNPKKKRSTIRQEISNNKSNLTKRILKGSNAINVIKDSLKRLREIKMKATQEDRGRKSKKTINNQKIKTKTMKLRKTPTTIPMPIIPIEERNLTSRQFGYRKIKKVKKLKQTMDLLL